MEIHIRHYEPPKCIVLVLCTWFSGHKVDIYLICFYSIYHRFYLIYLSLLLHLSIPQDTRLMFVSAASISSFIHVIVLKLSYIRFVLFSSVVISFDAEVFDFFLSYTILS